MNKNSLSPMALIITALSLSGCVIHVNGEHDIDWSGSNVSGLFGNVSVSEHKEVGDVSSVNGNIELEDHVTALEIDSVNGNIDIGDHVHVHSISMVNGDVDIGQHIHVEYDISSVNGNISIDENGEVGRNIDSVNADITLGKTQVNGSLITVNGDIHLLNNSSVLGDIVFKKKSNRHKSVPTLKIESGSTVLGQIILQSPVDLDIDDVKTLDRVVYDYRQ